MEVTSGGCGQTGFRQRSPILNQILIYCQPNLTYWDRGSFGYLGQLVIAFLRCRASRNMC
jgi:hypothetical protein